MGEFLPDVPLSEFRRLKVEQVRQLKSVNITGDGEYLCTVIIPNSQYIKVQTDYMGELSNAVGGKDIADVIEDMED